MNNKRTRYLLASILDGIIAIAVIVSVVWLFEFMRYEFPGSNKYAEYMKYFTVQSNIVLGVVALIALPFDILLAANKLERRPAWLRALYLCASVGTSVTMLTVIFFLGPTMGYENMYNEANMFMHLLTPLFGLCRVLFFEDKSLPFPVTFCGTAHMVIYGIFYMTNLVAHDGYGTLAYDWYGFGAGGIGLGILALFLMAGATYGISFLTYFIQKKMSKHWEAKA